MRWNVPRKGVSVSESRIEGLSRRDFFAKTAAAGTGALLSLAAPVIEKA